LIVAVSERFGAQGDFPRAYVIAHEIGHHVQHLLGTSDRVRAKGSDEGANSAAVRLELQADCFAGVWAHSTGSRKLLEQGDIDESLRAASAIGDDRLQRNATGTVTPETWSHGHPRKEHGGFAKATRTGAWKRAIRLAQQHFRSDGELHREAPQLRHPLSVLSFIMLKERSLRLIDGGLRVRNTL